MSRPKKTIKDLPKNWKSLVLKEMEAGASKQEVKVLLRISNDLFERFMKESKEFSETILYGVDLAEAWWLRQGRTNLKNKQFNYGGWYMMMKNRFGWKDRQATDVTSDNRPIAGVVLMPRKLTQEEADAGMQ